MSTCANCKSKPCWPGHKFCGKTCAKQATPAKPAAVQGQPLCQMCIAAAWYDSAKGKWSPGCDKTHAQQAIARGYTELR